MYQWQCSKPIELTWCLLPTFQGYIITVIKPHTWLDITSNPTYHSFSDLCRRLDSWLNTMGVLCYHPFLIDLTFLRSDWNIILQFEIYNWHISCIVGHLTVDVVFHRAQRNAFWDPIWNMCEILAWKNIRRHQNYNTHRSCLYFIKVLPEVQRNCSAQSSAV